MADNFVIEMRNITKIFGSLVANDNITLQLKKGEIHALLGENGAGKSTLMSVLFGMYEPDKGEIYKNGKKVNITNPNDATELGIGMVHQHFKLIEVFSVLDNIILGAETVKNGLLDRKSARDKIMSLSNQYHLAVDPEALIEDITVGMQQRVEILKMLYRDNEILIFDEPTAVLTPQEIEELMAIMKNLAAEGKSILFISHKLNEIMEVSDRITVLRKGKYIGTIETKNTNIEQLSEMMVGRPVQLKVNKKDATPGDVLLHVENLSQKSKIHQNYAVKKVGLDVREGEVVCIAGIDGNGQSEFIHTLTGLEDAVDFLEENGNIIKPKIELCGIDITKAPIRDRLTKAKMSHIPEDRHKHGLVLDFSLEDNIVLQRYFEPIFQKNGFIKHNEVTRYANDIIERYDVRSAAGGLSSARSMSGGNQQKAIIGRELDKDHKLLVAVQPTRGLDVGAIESVHSKIIAERDAGKGVLLVSFELEEVMNLSDRILVMYEGEIVGEFNPKEVTEQELGLYMAGAKRQNKEEK